MLHRRTLKTANVQIGDLRPLMRDELALLKEKRNNPPQPFIQRLRDPHHKLARLIAIGHTQTAAGRLSGYSVSSVTRLMQDPAFSNLVEHYRQTVKQSFVEEVDEYHELILGNMVKAERHIAERIEQVEEDNELLPIKDALAISRDAADRMGYGKRQTNTNINVDFAASLEKAIARSGKVIDAASSSPASGNPRRLGPPSNPPHQQPLAGAHQILRRA